MMTPRVSVIVPGHNVAGTLKATLSSLRSQEWPKDCLEIIYVDDASTDESIDIASEWADCIVRLTGYPKGPAGARNAGVRRSSGQILAFMDADVIASPETIRALVSPLMEDENLDAIFGSYDSNPLDPTLVSQYRNLLHHFVHQTSRRNAATFWAGCGAIRRRSFEKAGGFDEERSPCSIEDIELGHRMRALGMRIRLQPSIQVKHQKKWTLLRMVQTDIFLRGIPWMRLLFQERQVPGEFGDLNLKLSAFLSVALAWMSVFFLLFSLWFSKSIYGVFVALGLVLAINFATYRFFYQIRGIRFALMIIPLNILYHLYNGVSVIGSLLYRYLIDRPLPGLKSIGANLQMRYWRQLRVRREREENSRLPQKQENHRATGHDPPIQSDSVRLSSRKYLFSQLAIVLLAWLCLMGLQWQNDGLWFQGDSPRHAANGLFWKDFLVSGSLNPQDYALRYYARYPVISVTNYPPAFYILEGMLFAAYHPSPYAAKGLVLAFALLAACYLMVWLRRWIAVEAGWAAALLLLMPGFVIWSNAVMLNVPATAISLAALYHVRRWLDAPNERSAKRQLYLAALFSTMAFLTYYIAGILLFIIVVWLLYLRRWALLWDRRTVCVALAVTALSLPCLYVAFKWAPVYVDFVTESFQSVGTRWRWTFYLKQLPGLAGAFLLTVSILGLAIGVFRRRWRRESLLLLIFLLVAYLALSLILAKAGRYGLLFCIPITCFCAMAFQTLAECLCKRLKGGVRASSIAILTIALAACGVQAWMASQIRVPLIKGITEAVDFIERVAPNEPVFYDGYHHNIFTYYIQAGDPGYKRQVVLGAKLLYASGKNPMERYRSYVSSSEDVVHTLQARGGCRWLAIEVSTQSRQVPAANLLREAVRGPQFEFIRSFPISGPGLDRIDVYRFKLKPHPTDEVDLPFPVLGEGVRFRAQPIQR